jgi:hypothetical protein
MIAARRNRPPVSANDVARSAASGVPIVGGALNKLDAATNAALAPVLNRFFAPENQLSEPSFRNATRIRCATRKARTRDLQPIIRLLIPAQSSPAELPRWCRL